MSEDQRQVIGMMKRREHDIEIMQLLLKHNLARNRAECKLLIMYYKACNMISRAKLTMLGIDDSNGEMQCTPEMDNSIKRMSFWDEHFEKLASRS
jgi:hypothetical protein